MSGWILSRVGVRRFSLVFAALLGIVGVYLIVYVDYEIRVSSGVGSPSYAYYVGLIMLALSIASFVAPIIFPPKRRIPKPPFTLKCPYCGEKLVFVDGNYECLKCGHVIDGSPMLVSMRDLASLVDLAMLSCSNYCELISRYKYCSTLLKYADFFNASLPSKCPLSLRRPDKNGGNVK
ncbi:MAG: hypothetical protein DRJ18_03265 [Candidatus Methanomethylicota archaeon]|nr:MAG: hypothetical protein DRJ18_03265 [Candidatus Verstraetearchaeota archaeon]